MNLFKTILILLSLNSFGYDSIRTDLTDRWRGPDQQPKEKLKVNSNVLHLKLKVNDNGVLEMRSVGSFAIFINNQLVQKDIKITRYKLDSLKTFYVFPITISVFSKNGLKGFSSEIVSQGESGESALAGTWLASSISLVAFLLVWGLILLLYTNRPVTLEYFNFVKIFSIRKIDEGVFPQRVTSFNNVFIYIFCSALAAFNLILFGLAPATFSPGFTLVNLIVLTGGILILFLIKILLVNFTARIFGLSETGPNQFFNFVKLSVACFTFSSICLLLIFILGGETAVWRNIIAVFILIMLGLYLIVTFLRLMNRGGFTVFHLFSYLCVSEIFPVLLLLKIYYI